MEIQLNGQKITTEKRWLKELLNEKKIDDEVIIINGFQEKTNIEVHEHDEIITIKKGIMPDETVFELMLSARHTPNVYRQLKKATVGVAGLGGLGSNISIDLARTGVGHLILADYDIVEPSNLNRQNYYIKHLGMKKTQALYEQIKEINPYIKVTLFNQKINRQNACEVFKQCEIVCEAFDGAEEKAMLVNEIIKNTKETIVVAASGMAGYKSANSIVTKRKMTRLYICGDQESEAKQGSGLMAPRVKVCSGHQSNTVIRLLLNEKGE